MVSIAGTETAVGVENREAVQYHGLSFNHKSVLSLDKTSSERPCRY